MEVPKLINPTHIFIRINFHKHTQIISFHIVKDMKYTSRLRFTYVNNSDKKKKKRHVKANR
jgi:hypothetical protein